MLILASMEPIDPLTPSQIARSMPSAAGDDLLEWSSGEALPEYLAAVVSGEFETELELDPDRRVRITDDHPYNEYFLLRRWGLL